MKVVMKTIETGPKGNWYPGDIRAVDREHGEQLIAGHYAEKYVKEAPEMETTTEPEAEEREQAVATPKKKRATKKVSTKE